MKNILKILLFFSVATNAQFLNQSQNRLIVKMKSNYSPETGNGVSIVRHLFGRHYLLFVDSTEDVSKSLYEQENVEYVEFDKIAAPKTLFTKAKTIESKNKTSEEFFNDKHVRRQWHFKGSTNHGVSVSDAYLSRSTNPREKTIVAVVDTGVMVDHKDLKDVMWRNEGEIADNGIDDDGNGYIDDVYGINTLKRRNGIPTGDVSDSHSHGTHVSGIIGAKQNNKIGIAGVASNIKIMAIKTVPNRGDETDSDVIESFIYAAKMGAKVINCSFGKERSGKSVAAAISHIGKEYGVLVVAAAGNSSRNIDSRPAYPASFQSENLLVVASTTNRGRLSNFSNWGKVGVDIAAPGSAIYSTVLNNRYKSYSGTSMASPVVAGVAAEILSNRPELTPLEVKSLLMSSSIKSKRFETRILSGGKVDLKKSLESL